MTSVFNDYYSHENHGPFELFELGNFSLEEGGTLHDGKLAYTTQGTLSAQKDNAILMPTWYSGTSKIMADVHVGKGRAIDPGQVFRHYRQPTRQRSVKFAVQYARPVQYGAFPAHPDRRRCPRPA